MKVNRFIGHFPNIINKSQNLERCCFFFCALFRHLDWEIVSWAGTEAERVGAGDSPGAGELGGSGEGSAEESGGEAEVAEVAHLQNTLVHQ